MKVQEPLDRLRSRETGRQHRKFLPSPGASLNQFASGTAKHLISLTDPQDKTEPVNYQQIKGNV